MSEKCIDEVEDHDARMGFGSLGRRAGGGFPREAKELRLVGGTMSGNGGGNV